MLSFGSAIGALVVGVVAPRVFGGYWELGIGLTLTALLAAVTLRRKIAILPLAALGAAAACAYYTYREAGISQRRAPARAQLLRIAANPGHGIRRRAGSGPTAHPRHDHPRPARARARASDHPTAYYGPTSGVGRALQSDGSGRRSG